MFFSLPRVSRENAMQYVTTRFLRMFPFSVMVVVLELLSGNTGKVSWLADM